MPEPLTITAAAILLPYASAFASSWKQNSVFRNGTAASIQTVAYVTAPTGVTSVIAETRLPLADPSIGGVADSTGWMEVAQAVFGGSRSMTETERAALDEFTWSELRS